MAEYGAVVEYRKGKNNIRADMLSRIKSESSAEVAVIHADMANPADDNESSVGCLKSNEFSPSEFTCLQRADFHRK